jgi:transcription antitermination factor NusG
VIRPEIIINRVGETLQEELVQTGELKVGNSVRVIRNPYFGRIGKVVDLPSELTPIPTGAAVRILEVEFDDGEKVALPRANIELIMG